MVVKLATTLRWGQGSGGGGNQTTTNRRAVGTKQPTTTTNKVRTTAVRTVGWGRLRNNVEQGTPGSTPTFGSGRRGVITQMAGNGNWHRQPTERGRITALCPEVIRFLLHCQRRTTPNHGIVTQSRMLTASTTPAVRRFVGSQPRCVCRRSASVNNKARRHRCSPPYHLPRHSGMAKQQIVRDSM